MKRSTPCVVFFFQAEDGIRDLVRSRGLGDVDKRQEEGREAAQPFESPTPVDAINAALVDEMFYNPWQLSLIHI